MACRTNSSGQHEEDIDAQGSSECKSTNKEAGDTLEKWSRLNWRVRRSSRCKKRKESHKGIEAKIKKKKCKTIWKRHRISNDEKVASLNWDEKAKVEDQIQMAEAKPEVQESWSSA